MKNLSKKQMVIIFAIALICMIIAITIIFIQNKTGELEQMELVVAHHRQ